MPQSPQSRSEQGPDTPASPDGLAPTLPASHTRPDPPSDGTFPPEAADLLGALRLDPSGTPDETTEFLAPLPDVGPDIRGYEILGEIGHGGMGVVYKARQVALNRVVALKMIGTAAWGHSTALVRFFAEAEAVAAIKHPNVVEVYHLGRRAGRPYFVMEYVDGGTLAARLAAGALAPREAAALVAAIARGVQAAHAAGIVHRDLKPGNILLSSERGTRNAESTAEDKPGGPSSHSEFPVPHSAFQPKVSDFGVAKRLGDVAGLTHVGAVLGTPAYMAPEQADGTGKFVGPEADIYALGVILYECLTGARPFDGDDPVSLLRRVMDEPPVSPRKRLPSVPRDLELICLRCLEKEPHHRYTTAAELADDLDRFLAGRPVTARPLSVGGQVCRWVQRNPAWALVILLALGLVVGLPPAVIWYRAELATSQAAATAADQARVRAIEARQAAERLAATQELFALESTIRRRSVDRLPGWTWDNRADLVEAAARSTAEGRSLIDLRSDAAATLLSPDLRAVDPWNTGLFTAAVATTSPDGSVVALAEFKAWGLPTLPGLAPATGTVLLVDPKTGQSVRKLAFPVAPVRNKDGNSVQDGARAMAFSPDGKRLFVGTRASKVIRFDLGARNGKRTEWDARAGEFRQLGVSPDGTTLYGVCDGEKSLLRWDARTGKGLPGFASPHGVLAFAVEPTTGDVIVSDGPTLYRLDPATMRPRSSTSVERGHARHLAFVGEGRVLVAGHGDQLDLCDQAGLRFTNRFTDPGLRRSAHEDTVGAIAVHPSGAFVATAARGDVERQVKVWSVASGRLVGFAAVPGTGPIALAWCDGGRVLLATSPGRVLRFEFSPGTPQEFVAFSPDPLDAVALAPDARGVATLADPAPDGTVALLRAARGAVTATSLPPWAAANIPGLVVTPGGTVLATRTGTGVTAWRPGTPPRDAGFTDRLVRYPRLSPDGEVLWAVVDSSSILAWDADRRTSRGAWSNAAAEFLSGLSSLDALAAGRARAVVGGRDGTVHVFDDRVKHVAQFIRPGDPVLAVGLTADESLAVAGTRSGVVRVLRLADGVELPAFAAHAGGVTALAVSREGLLVTGGKDRAVRVWRWSGERFEPVLSIDRLTAPVQSLEFAASDNRLLVLLANEHAARLWDLGLLRAECAALGLGW